MGFSKQSDDDNVYSPQPPHLTLPEQWLNNPPAPRRLSSLNMRSVWERESAVFLNLGVSLLLSHLFL